jgi:hypothetical protein
MEIEINFCLDENGRTASTLQPTDPGGSNELEKNQSLDVVDYSYRVAMTNLQPSSLHNDDGNTSTEEQDEKHQKWIDDLLFDCEISDSGLMPRTFWVPAAQGFAPRCSLEQFALDVFHYHVPKDFKYDLSCSGAEWWCQLRPSPEKTGRYAMHCTNKDDEDDRIQGELDPFAQGISMHVDKDEELRILTGGTTYIHPHLSTVTYFTSLGSPTMIMNCRVHPLEGTWMCPHELMEGFVSWPAMGKHISFDGRYLHAAPCDLMSEGSFEKQIQFTPTEADPQRNKIQTRRHRRVTFLVNIWLNYHPFDVNPFPDTMIDKMSGQQESERRRLLFTTTYTSSSAMETHIRTVSMTSTLATEGSMNGETEQGFSYMPTKFVWPLGDKRSKEWLTLQIPLQSIRREERHGGNVSIQWTNNDGDSSCFHLHSAHVTEASDPASVSDTISGDTKDTREGEVEPGRAKRARVDDT